MRSSTGKMGNKVARCCIETGISEGRMQWERNGKEWQGKDKSAWERRKEDGYRKMTRAEGYDLYRQGRGNEPNGVHAYLYSNIKED